MGDLKDNGLIWDGSSSPSESRVSYGPQTKVDNIDDPYFLYEHDPDLIVEVDIQLDRHDTNRIGKPRRRINSRVSSKSTGSSPQIKNRGRAKRYYEMEPFLSVDNIPPEKIAEMGKLQSFTGARVTPAMRRNQSAVSTEQQERDDSLLSKILQWRNDPTFTQVAEVFFGRAKSAPVRVQNSRNSVRRSRSSTTAVGGRTQSSSAVGGRSPYTSPAYRLRPYPDKRTTPSPKTPEGQRAGLSTPGGISGFQSPNKVPKRINHCVKHPFKHSVSVKPVTDPMSLERGTTPSSDMKERTALATFHVGKVLAKDNTERQRRLQGKLLKGKLQPLKPVVANGPNIKQCRGIVAETRTYGAPPNRTLARRRELIQTIPNIHEYLYDRPQTVESIHRTSEASSVDENRDNTPHGDFSDQELSDKLDRMVTSVTEVTMPYAPPGSSATNYSKMPVEIPHGQESPRMFPTEINSEKDEEKTDEQASRNIRSKLNLLDDSYNTQNSTGIQRQFTDDMVLDGHGSLPDSRPHTAGNVSTKSKSVRFVDDSPLSGRDSSRPHIGMSDNEKSEKKSFDKSKEKKKNSCKPSDSNKDKKHDDSDDDHSPRRPGSDKDRSSKGQGDRSKSRTGSGKSSNGDRKVSSANKNRQEGKEHRTVPGMQNTYSVIYYTDSSHLKELENRVNNNGDTDMNKAIENNNNKHSSEFDEKRLSAAKELETNRKGRTKLTPGKKGNLVLESNSHDSENSKNNSTNQCDRYRANTTPATLQVQTVMHNGQVHSIVCPESPSIRSRSPSPSRGSQKSHPLKISENRKQIEKNNKLIRPSSAHKTAREKQSRDIGSKLRISKNSNISSLSKSSSTDSCELSSEQLSDQNSKMSPRKVYFKTDDAPQPERPSIFVETLKGDEVVVSINEDRQITFADIEAEIMALREDIQDKMQSDFVHNWSQDSDSSDVERLDLDSVRESQKCMVKQQDTWRDYGSLLDMYRKKCMEASENCGEISETLTTPRLLRHVTIATKVDPSKEEVKLKRSGSVLSQATEESGNVESSGVFTLDGDQTSTAGLARTESELTITDSAVSVDPESKSQKLGLKVTNQEDRNKEDCVVPPINLDSLTSEETVKQEGQALLDIVCDELSKDEQTEQTTNSTNQKLPLEDLEIVAQPKTLTKHKQKKDQNKGPVAPFAPLCFEINARPPKGFLYYFAYGTDMNITRLTAYVRREPVRFWGLLFGFQLVFNKKGCDPAAGGFPNIEFNPYCSVEGCIYPITQEELQLLDKHLGYPQHYEHLVLPVWMMNSKENPDQYGVAQYCVPALTYIAQDKWIAKDEKLDSDYSLSQCVKSSAMVTPAYRGHMVSLTTPSCATVSA